MTKLNYLKDTYVFEGNSIFLEKRETDHGIAVILDETIFYPQGGGQPADQGGISSENAVFVVKDVRLNEDGEVLHFGEFEKGEFSKGDNVNLQIDKDKRTLNAKNHSAGHLLDCAVTKMGLKDLAPTKGFHFPDGSYVEYDGVLENPAELIPELEKTVNELIEKNLKVENIDLSPEEAKVQGVWAPPGKGARVVNFSEFEGCGCGGTHVNSALEIGKIVIRKIKSKKGKTRISYIVE